MPANNLSFYCARCGTKFTRLDVFKKHTLKRSTPSNRCKNKYNELDWSVYCKDSQKQIDYYNKHKKKKFMYTSEPTKEQVTKLVDSSDQIHAIMRYTMNKPFYQPVIEKFLNRKIKDGYRILTVERGHHEWEKRRFTYLIKNDIMSHDDVFVKNFYKINPEHSVVHSDEYDRVYCISDFDERMETYKIRSDNTFFKPNTPDRPDYGVTDIFYNITFDRNTRKFIHHEHAINKLVSSCTKNRQDFQIVNELIRKENKI